MDQELHQELDNLTKRLNPVFKDEDLRDADEIKSTMATPGWACIEKIWKEQKEMLWQTVRRAKNSDNVWRVLGVIEGHDMTTKIINGFLTMSEKETQRREHDRLVALKEKEFEHAGY